MKHLLNAKATVKKLKAFTLLELIIVMAIIAILAGMGSLAISGFISDSKAESCNTSARLVYSAAQNMLIQAEMGQCDEVLHPDWKAMTNADQCLMVITMDNGEIDTLLTYIMDSTVTPDTSIDDFPNNESNILEEIDQDTTMGKEHAKTYQFLDSNMFNSLSNDFTGNFKIYMDLENYIVQSVVFAEDPTASLDGLTYLKEYKFTDVELKANSFKSYATYNDVKEQAKLTGEFYGAYPIMSDLDPSSIALN